MLFREMMSMKFCSTPDCGSKLFQTSDGFKCQKCDNYEPRKNKLTSKPISYSPNDGTLPRSGEEFTEKQLYEKLEHLEHQANVLIQLHRISEKIGEPFDFQDFLKSDDPKDLRYYADYFYNKSGDDIGNLKNTRLI